MKVRVILLVLVVTVFAACERSSAHVELLAEMIETVEATTEVLKTIDSVEDARAVQAELQRLSQRALDTQEKMVEVTGTEVPVEARRKARDHLERYEKAMEELMQEGMRLQGDPAIWAVLGDSLHGFR